MEFYDCKNMVYQINLTNSYAVLPFYDVFLLKRTLFTGLLKSMAVGEVGARGVAVAPPVVLAFGDATAPVTVRGQARTEITALVTVSIRIYAWTSSVCNYTLLII